MGHDLAQELRELDLQGVHEREGDPVFELAADSLVHHRVAIAQDDGTQPHVEIEKLVAVHVPHPRAAAAREVFGRHSPGELRGSLGERLGARRDEPLRPRPKGVRALDAGQLGVGLDCVRHAIPEPAPVGEDRRKDLTSSAAPSRKSPCPAPRAKACRRRSPSAGSSAGPSSDGASRSRPFGVRRGIRRSSSKGTCYRFSIGQGITDEDASIEGIGSSGQDVLGEWWSAPATRPTPSCTFRAGNPGTPCHRTIAISSAIGWKGGRCPWRVGPWRVGVLILKPAAGAS